MNDKDHTVILSLNEGNGQHGRLWAYDDITPAEDRPADFTTGLVSLAFIRAAIRRSMWFWCTTAAIGFLIGVGTRVALPPSYQASTSLLLTVDPNSPPGSAILDEQAVAQSHEVAGLVVRKLGLRESVGSFLGSYTATPVSYRVLAITVNAPTANDAVIQANAVAAAFLQYRKNQLLTQQQLVFESLDLQINQAKQQVSSITRQITQLSAQPASPARKAKLASLRTQQNQAASQLTTLQNDFINQQVNSRETTTSMIQGSQVLDPATPLPHHRLKPLVVHGGIGLIAGLALGLGIVIVRALVSDRLRRRDDVAYALGAPVKLSVGAVRLSRWLPGRRGLAAAGRRDIRRIVAHLHDAVPKNSRQAATLAVVAVDDPHVAALSLTSLALSYAKDGMQVVLADLASGAPAARLVGVRKPGIRAVRVQDAHLVVALPDPSNVVPVGPRHHTSPHDRAAPSRKLVAAYDSADLLLTLATLDPSLGGEHLATWAADAVVVVTAGRSSWTKIHAVGEMIRLADTRLVSTVLVGADKTDESLGVIPTPSADRETEVVEDGLHSIGGLDTRGRAGSRGGPSGDR
jgi:capsular polysaccharide biosynthesis protein